MTWFNFRLIFEQYHRNEECGSISYYKNLSSNSPLTMRKNQYMLNNVNLKNLTDRI